MSAAYILAHDLGTTGNKATLYDRQGQVQASSFYGYDTHYPQRNWAEQNPEDWWQAVCVSTRRLLSAAGVTPQDIACVSFSGQMMGCVPVDAQARPLRSAIIWADQRAVEEARLLVERASAAEIYRITGHRPSASYSGEKIMWLRRWQPDLFLQAHKFLQAKDYIVARLTGKFVTDYSDASGTNLYDLERRDWSDTLLQAAQIERRLLPELHASSDVIGEATPWVTAETGLAAGTPVVIGGGDGACAAAGAGVVRPGAAYNYIGSSSWIGIASPRPIFDPAQRTFTFAHLPAGLFTPTGTMQSAGGSYQWARGVFAAAEQGAAAALGISPYELMNLQVEKSPPGANGLIYLPYLMGERSPRWNPEARGAYIGLTMQHTRADILRATLEGVAFNLRVILKAFQEQGAGVEMMRVIGGGARGGVWRQILADIYGLPIARPALLEEATSLGAAIAGGVGVGVFPDFSIAETLAPLVDVTPPNPATQHEYRRLYALFNRLYEALEPLYADFSA